MMPAEDETEHMKRDDAMIGRFDYVTGSTRPPCSFLAMTDIYKTKDTMTCRDNYHKSISIGHEKI